MSLCTLLTGGHLVGLRRCLSRGSPPSASARAQAARQPRLASVLARSFHSDSGVALIDAGPRAGFGGIRQIATLPAVAQARTRPAAANVKFSTFSTVPSRRWTSVALGTSHQ